MSTVSIWSWLRSWWPLATLTPTHKNGGDRDPLPTFPSWMSRVRIPCPAPNSLEKQGSPERGTPRRTTEHHGSLVVQVVVGIALLGLAGCATEAGSEHTTRAYAVETTAPVYTVDQTVPGSGVGEAEYVEAACEDVEDVLSDGRCTYANAGPQVVSEGPSQTEDGRASWRCSRQAPRETPYGTVTASATCTGRR